ncbi:MAG: DUF4011 domain-containing protein [Clostridia bacterium]|nr:DUF4011 domain-containing protein [Clostridia bacterium]
MAKSIYTYYKERLIEIGGNNKCLYLKSIVRKSAYDLGRIFEKRDGKTDELVSFLFTSKHFPLPVISAAEKNDITENLGVKEKEAPAGATDAERRRIAKAYRDSCDRAIENEIAKLKDLQREVEEIEKETGRYELYVGYPFVFGCIPQGGTKTLMKAPLLLFPVRIDFPDEGTAEISINENEKIRINHALVYAYAQAKKLNIEGLDLELDDMSKFPTVRSVIDYLAEAHIKIDATDSKHIYPYSMFKEPDNRSDLSVRYGAVLARFPLSNSIYRDYTELEKKKLYNDAVNELLHIGKQKKKRVKKSDRREQRNSYAVKMLDFAQSEVVKKVDEKGNMVIYGPPGTGKSQTIVNVITDAICKNKRVLVVSQKKAALDVVYNRLGILNSKAMYISDETREKRSFYERCLSAHQRDMVESLSDVAALEGKYNETEAKIREEEKKLRLIERTLTEVRPFGLSLADMYASSVNYSKSSYEYSIYQRLIAEDGIMSLNYKELSEALFGIREMNLAKTYYDFLQDKEKNPLIDNMQQGLDIRTLAEVKGEIEEIQKAKKGLFGTAKYPYYRLVLAYYYELDDAEQLDAVVRMQRRMEMPDKRLGIKKAEAEIKAKILETRDAIHSYVKEYDCLNRVMTPDGYLAVIDNILRGNTAYIKLVYEALDNYIALRDVNKLIEGLDAAKLSILNFAYTVSKSRANYNDIIASLLDIRIYHEVLRYEEECADSLSVILDYDNITAKIYKHKEEQLEIAYKLCAGKNSKEYETLYENGKDNKDYLYQISKKQKFWPIRKMMEIYGGYVLTLFPCWLLSPENVSNLLPLEKNMFDVVIFDEASQVFIESTIPTIYRGKSIVVAGDDKQLRPSATFMKRYLGADPELQEDLSVQAALEVDSLLDLAVARYDSANLTYHYRSRHQELIDFSNAAFYSSGLQIAPNISKNKSSRPIERYKVNGRWIDRRNPAEAEKVVDLLSEISKSRTHNESVGIITFNSEQQSCIADAIDRRMAKDADFRSFMLKERHRLEGGEDTSIFIKNLENVQGDERDIIIFSIGYAENEEGKLYTSFGSLSVEGGENRLNVAVTRARSKIIVVTSIEPEELKVEGSKHLGPKLLKKYLTYVRAVAKDDAEEVRVILSELNPAETKAESLYTSLKTVEEQMKERLEKLGYRVETSIGNRNNRISLAIYDPESDRYLVGVELDRDAFAASSSPMERDVYKPRFLESRGWTLMRVWCRDWWLSPTKVVKSIAAAADKSKKAK